MNLYDQLHMRPMSPQAAAQTVLGVGAPGAVAPLRPDVHSLFARGGLARSVINASVDMDYVLGQSGVGLNGLGLAGGSFTVFGPFGFAGGWSSNDFFDQSRFDLAKGNYLKSYDIDYEAPSSTLVANATRGYNYLKTEADNGNVQAQAELTNLSDQMNQFIKLADSLTDQHDTFGGRAPPIEAQRYGAFADIVNTMKMFASAPQRIPPDAGGGTAQVPSTRGGRVMDPITAAYLNKARTDVATQQATNDAITQQTQIQQTLAKQQQGAATAADSGGMPSWVLPVGIGVALLGVAAVVLTHKKKK